MTLGNGVTVTFQNGFVGGAAQTGQQLVTTYALPPASPVVGLLPQSTQVDVNVGLPIPNLAGLETLVNQRADPTNPMYRQWLKPSDFMTMFAPSTADYGMLTAWANGRGLQVVTYPSNLSVDVVGTAAQIEQAFHVNLVQAQRADGSVFYEPDRQPSIDLAVTPTVTVVGLAGIDNYVAMLPKNRTTAPKNTLGAVDMQQDYLGIATPGSPCAGITGAGQTIGVFATIDFVDTDITTYEANLGLSGVPKPTRNGTAPPPSPGAEGETSQDIETAISVAPGAQVVVFEGTNVDAILNNMIKFALVPGNTLNQVTNSYYAGPTSSTQGLLALLAGLGTSFFEATSDFGAWQPANVTCCAAQLTLACQTGSQLELVTGSGPSCSSLTPTSTESSPFATSATQDLVSMDFVTLVGGTTLSTDGVAGYTPGDEQGWNGSGGGSFAPGGGFAGIKIPDYQAGPNKLGPNPGNPAVSAQWRNVPDVSIVSTNHYSVFNGVAQPFGGTSSAAPSWAGFTAVINDLNPNGSFGFLNPGLYRVGANAALYSQSLNDIDDTGDGVTTNNACGVAFTAGAGYDLVTGLGTPKCGLGGYLPRLRNAGVGAGLSDTCAVHPDGTVRSSGDMGGGDHGNGLTTGSTIPVRATGVTKDTAVSVGFYHTSALLTTGGIDCWGDDVSGELGNGTTSLTSFPTPVAVQGLPGTAVAIGTGFDVSCALMSAGTVACWGDNSEGTLGLGNDVSESTPTVIPNLSGVVSIGVGSSHACALLRTGTVDCWGDNFEGALGDGTTTQRDTPVAVQNLSGATALALGDHHSCAIIANGAIECWGDNDFGQLGDGTVTERHTPVLVSGITGATAVAGRDEDGGMYQGDRATIAPERRWV